MQPCPLCGDQFQVTNARKKFCDYYDEAEDWCRTAQDDLEEAADIAAALREEAECAHCGEPAGWTGKGRPRRFCSPICKQRDYRARKAAERAQDAA
jgi:endogenous inhibitor of DNA gyrase (YacG/DUF329 family)